MSYYVADGPRGNPIVRGQEPAVAWRLPCLDAVDFDGICSGENISGLAECPGMFPLRTMCIMLGSHHAFFCSWESFDL